MWTSFPSLDAVVRELLRRPARGELATPLVLAELVARVEGLPAGGVPM